MAGYWNTYSVIFTDDVEFVAGSFLDISVMDSEYA